MFSEVLLEEGLGETRALVLEDGDVAEAHVERAGEGLPRAGDLWDVRLARSLHGGRRAVVRLGDCEALLEPLPAGAAEGALVRVEVVREAVPEPGRPRLAKVAPAAAPAGSRAGRIARGPTLAARLARSGRPVRRVPAEGDDLLEAAGWSEVMEEAATGTVLFPGGRLTIALTPAMTVIDVDGDLPPAALALLGAETAARAVRRLDIQGSIGVDLPTLGSRADRQAAALAFDRLIPQPFERTAVNGFGFIQLVRRRTRPSLLELVQGAPVETAALALLRRAQRSRGVGERTIVAHPAVAAWIGERPQLLDALSRGLGAPVSLQPDPALTISGGDVSARQA